VLHRYPSHDGTTVLLLRLLLHRLQARAQQLDLVAQLGIVLGGSRGVGLLLLPLLLLLLLLLLLPASKVCFRLGFGFLCGLGCLFAYPE
jgi:hypothetical protein